MFLIDFLNRQKIQAHWVEAIVFDFDGVFTNNKVIVDENGKESVICNRADGLGIKMLRAKNIPMLILSTEANLVVKMRAQKLNLEVFQGIADKKEALLKLSKEKNINLKNTIYVGNDINDFEAMKMVGFPIAPKDANPSILRIAKYITKSKGGEGVIRELADIIK